MLASIVFVAAAGIIAIRPFFGKKTETSKRAHEAPPRLWLPPMLLACLGILFGIMPSLVEGPLLRSAVQAIVRKSVNFDLALWHGFNLPLALSAVSLACGAALYAGGGTRVTLPRVCKSLLAWGPQHWYDHLLAGMNRWRNAKRSSCKTVICAFIC